MEKEITHEMIVIPQGEFTMGISKEQAEKVVADFYKPSPPLSPFLHYAEAPEHTVRVAAFRLSKYEVTNSEFKEFVDAGIYKKMEYWDELIQMPDLNTDYVGVDRIKIFTDLTGALAPATWKDRNFPQGKGNHPVDGVSWFEAMAYCRWKDLRLPTEAEWEYSARGTDRRFFPWGNDAGAVSQAVDLEANETAPIGSHEIDKSPFGVMDLAANVSEWVSDSWLPYADSPLGQLEKRDDSFGVLRGGSYYSWPAQVRTTCRQRMDKLERRPGFGFRCAGNV